MELSAKDYPQPDFKSGKIEYKTIEEMIPQYTFGLGGSFKLKQLVDEIEGAEALVGAIKKKADQLGSYKIG